jgi:ParB/RepB/Spo0J family partition protein
MPSHTTRSEKLDLRLTRHAKRVLQAAAAVAHRSVSEFVLESALARADEALADRRSFGLNATQWKAFLTALDTPPRALPHLEQLLKEPGFFDTGSRQWTTLAAFGAHRLRGAKLAELAKLPVRIVKLTDAEAIEAQRVENLQRENIHQLEEALGFKSLLELGEHAYTIATNASRAGKSEAYVYGRIRLADLIPPVAEAFLKDQITIGHALQIAKLPASQQQEAFSAAFRGLWTSEGNSQVLIPVRELALCGAPHNAEHF